MNVNITLSVKEAEDICFRYFKDNLPFDPNYPNGVEVKIDSVAVGDTSLIKENTCLLASITHKNQELREMRQLLLKQEAELKSLKSKS